MIKWKNGNLKVVIDGELKYLFGHVQDFMLHTFFDVAEYGASQMQRIISTTESGIIPGKSNRVDTGLMHDSIAVSDEIKSRDNGFSVSTGWVNGYMKYFLTQEHGGMSDGLRRGDRYISPMHMLSQSRILMAQKLRSELGHAGFTRKGWKRAEKGVPLSYNKR